MESGDKLMFEKWFWRGRAPKLALWLSALGLLFVALLNAWVSDDAYITFRTCFNFVHGHGPVYNPGERVQTFTNPLWMLLMSAFYFFTGEAYFTSIFLSLGLLAATIGLLQRHVFRGSWAGVVAVFLLGWSLSFVEYSTSGLENMLNGFLLTVFFILWNKQEHGRKELIQLSLVAALGMVSRMDTALLYLPVLLAVSWQHRRWRTLGWMALGFFPFIAWELFATFYYGFPFPNTAYAKLNAGISQWEYWQHGIWYYANALRRDPLTLGILVAGIGSLALAGMRRQIPFGAGILLYAVYVARIGGDFMAGRFLFLPLLGSLILFGMGMEQRSLMRMLAVLLLLVGIANPGNPWYNGWRPQQPLRDLVDAHGIADERGWYHDAAALAALNDTMWALGNERNLDRHSTLPAKPTVLFWDFLGYMGYGVGPEYYVCDRYALADPLLARLPMSDVDDWRIGHFERVFPRGYRKTLRTGENHLEDPQLREYYNRLCTVTRGPLWSWKRISEILHFNAGKYERLVDKAYYRHPSQMKIGIEELQNRHPTGEAYGQNGQVELFSHRPLDVALRPGMKFSRFEICLFPESDYIVDLLHDSKSIVEMRILSKWDKPGMAIDTIDVPAELVGKFDAIRVEGIGGNEYYSIGHLIPLKDE